MKRGILVLGILLLLSGAFFALQGAGIILWPPESTMLARTAWIGRGGLIALAGAILIVAARRIRK